MNRKPLKRVREPFDPTKGVVSFHRKQNISSMRRLPAVAFQRELPLIQNVLLTMGALTIGHYVCHSTLSFSAIENPASWRGVCSQTLLNLLQLCKSSHDTWPFDLYKNKALIQQHKQWVFTRSSTHCEDLIWTTAISILLNETAMLWHIDPTSLHGYINGDVSINLPGGTWCISFIFITITWPVLHLLQSLL